MPAFHSVLLQDVSFRHGSATPILSDATAHLSAGWTGVVGANGSGKSTLLRLVAGELRPDAGAIRLPPGAVVCLVPQGVDVPDPGLRAFGRDHSGLAPRWRARFELAPDDLDRWPELSHGTRKRWQLAAALSTNPDVLLLDEPTNHLDRSATDLLLSALQRHRGIGMLVSHDRHVLDALSTSILRLLPSGRLEVRPGNWSRASAQWRREEEHAVDVEREARRQERRLRALQSDLREATRKVADDGARIRRQAGARQPDAREAGRRFAAAKAEAALARRTAQVGARLGRAAERGADVPDRQPGGPLRVPAGAARRPVVASLRTPRVAVDGHTVLTDVDVAVLRGDRIVVTGDNGAGKSTLLRALVQPGPGVGILPQDHDGPAAAALLADVHGLDPTARGRVLGTLALLGVEPARLLRSPSPSQGEIRKLALAQLLVVGHELLVLDEPTNHLDLPSIERLEQALAETDGALLLVTHDQHLATAVTSTRWHVRGGRVETGVTAAASSC